MPSPADMTDYTLVVLGLPGEAPPGYLLEASRLSLGAGEADDVFLSGVGVVPGHVQLIFLDRRITLLSASEEIRLNGQAIERFPVEWPALQALSLSPDTHLSYGPVDSVWPAPPEWPQPSEDLAGDLPATDLMDAEEPSFARGRAPAEPKTVKQHVVTSAWMGGVVMGVAALLVVGVVVFDLVWGNREVVNPGQVAIDRSEDVLERLLASEVQKYGTVNLTKRDDGALTISGFIETEDAYQSLAQQVRQQLVLSKGNVRLDALTLDRLQALVRDQISRYPLGSQVKVLPDTVKLTIFGVQTDMVDVARLSAELGRLKDRVAPRKFELNFQLETPETLMQEISTALAQSPTTRDLQFTINDTGGVISGMAAPASEADARRLLDEIQYGFAQRLPLTFDLKVDPKLNFTVVSLTLGGNGASATLVQRGKAETFREGDPVFGVGELREIKGNGVVVAMGKRELFVPLVSR